MALCKQPSKGWDGRFIPSVPFAMNIDSDRGVDVLRTEAVRVGTSLSTVFAAIETSGYPENGGPSAARQDGEQFVLRFRMRDYKSPCVHDKLHTKNYGTLEVKQAHPEGNLWAVRAMGKAASRTEVG
jgi:hypothetical protein